MFRHLTALCLALLLIPDPSLAQTRDRIGYGRLFTNDYFADQKDRWRSGSFASSRIWGYGWDGTLPAQPGSVLELRLGAEIIAPSNLVRPARGDRPYAGVLSAGLHTHFRRAAVDISLGADLVAVGPQTGLDAFQSELHGILGLDRPSDRTRAAQIPDAFHPTLVVEAGHNLALSAATRLRPFVEARAGVETYARAGFDLTIGTLTQDDLLVRDPVSGNRYRTIPGRRSGYAVVLGADVAAVDQSAYFPASSGVALRDQRNRYRAGLHWQMGRAHGFYGLTYLDKEFEGQTEGQLTGSLRVSLQF